MRMERVVGWERETRWATQEAQAEAQRQGFGGFHAIVCMSGHSLPRSGRQDVGGCVLLACAAAELPGVAEGGAVGR